MPGNWPSHEVVGDRRVCIPPGQGGPKPPKHGAELCPKRFGKRLPIDNESGEQAAVHGPLLSGIREALLDLYVLPVA